MTLACTRIYAYPKQKGGVRSGIVDITIPLGAYPAGGYTLAPADLKLDRIILIVPPGAVVYSGTTAYCVWWAPGAGKIKLFQPTGTTPSVFMTAIPGEWGIDKGVTDTSGKGIVGTVAKTEATAAYSVLFEAKTFTYKLLSGTAVPWTAAYQLISDLKTDDDAVYFGKAVKFMELSIDMSATVQTYTGDACTWEYYAGPLLLWQPLNIVYDGTDDTAQDGKRSFGRDGVITFKPPTDWQVLMVPAITGTTAYWIRCRFDTGANVNVKGITNAKEQLFSVPVDGYVAPEACTITAINAVDGRVIGTKEEIWTIPAFGEWIKGGNTGGSSVVGDVVQSTAAGAAYAKIYDLGSTTYANLAVAGGTTHYAANYQLTPDAASEVIGDACYFGHTAKFVELYFDLATLATHAGDSFTWEYWNGSAWTAITVIYDYTDTTAYDGKRSFQRDGTITFVVPDAWAMNTVDAQSAYWVRARITAANITQSPIMNTVLHKIVVPSTVATITPKKGSINAISIADQRDVSTQTRTIIMPAWGAWGIDTDGAFTNGAGLVGDIASAIFGAKYCKVYDHSDFAIDGGFSNIGASSARTHYTADKQWTPDAATEEINDAIYFGGDVKFCEFGGDFSAGTPATYGGDAYTWEYWNGAAWVALTLAWDGTDLTANDGKRPFQQSGAISFFPPADWAKTIVHPTDPINAYWIRARVTAVQITQACVWETPIGIYPGDGFVADESFIITKIQLSDGAATVHTTADVKFFLMNFTTGVPTAVLTFPMDKVNETFTLATPLTVTAGDVLGVVVTQEDGAAEPANVVLRLTATVEAKILHTADVKFRLMNYTTGVMTAEKTITASNRSLSTKLSPELAVSGPDDRLGIIVTSDSAPDYVEDALVMLTATVDESIIHTSDVKFYLFNFTSGTHSTELTWAANQQQDYWSGQSIVCAAGDKIGVVVSQEDGLNEIQNAMFSFTAERTVTGMPELATGFAVPQFAIRCRYEGS